MGKSTGSYTRERLFERVISVNCLLRLDRADDRLVLDTNTRMSGLKTLRFTS